MGRLKNGHWTESSVAPTDSSGNFTREESLFRETVSPDHPRFRPEMDRYHLYVSYACPWAHRTLIYRELKELKNVISLSVVHPEMLENGWSFRTDFPDATGDTIGDKDYLYQIYQEAKKDVTCKATVPVLWDKKEHTIVNNESAEIIRIFNSAFNELTGNIDDYYPKRFRHSIDELNSVIYSTINNGVYKAGFAKSQKAYEKALFPLFEILEILENKYLDKNDFLLTDQPLECDWRLFTTLVRFDAVYHYHFKCNIKKIEDFGNLSQYLKRLVNWPGVRSTLFLDHIKHHYYYSHDEINPFRIVPPGPTLSF